jgi:hypothetical protein
MWNVQSLKVYLNADSRRSVVALLEPTLRAMGNVQRQKGNIMCSSAQTRHIKTFIESDDPPIEVGPLPLSPPLFPRKRSPNGTKLVFDDMHDMIFTLKGPVLLSDGSDDFAEESLALVNGWSTSNPLQWLVYS